MCCNVVVRLFNGETQKVSVQLENIGKQPVESIELDVTYSQQQSKSHTVICITLDLCPRVLKFI